MWLFSFILLCYTMRFFFFGDCHVKHLDILFNFFLKIDLIWCDKFSCNFKYISINEIGFIKKIILVVGQIKKKLSFMGWGGVSLGPKGRGWGEKIFLVMQDGAGMEQDKIMQGRNKNPILRLCPASLPSLFEITLYPSLSLSLKKTI